MDDGEGHLAGGALLSQLGVIEDQPLEARAEAFARVHDALRSTLEGSDSVRAGE